ncbi:MAG TPA: ATP-binding protein, partial [Clostridia bacterium]
PPMDHPDHPQHPDHPEPYEQPNDRSLLRFYFSLNGSLREPLSVLNADYVLLDKDKKIITPFDEKNNSSELRSKVAEAVKQNGDFSKETSVKFSISGINYMAVIKPANEMKNLSLGSIIIFSSLQKINQLQWYINIILLIILIFSALIAVFFSSIVSKKISAPLSTVNHHIRSIAERNFGTKIGLPVEDELRELVNNINLMSEKLEVYENAQRTFLQNVSHEFRTPLMSIQSYAEGIKYSVVDNDSAVGIILDETKRMTRLVEDLLYLSRLETVDENFCFEQLDITELVSSCAERMKGIALKQNISIETDITRESIEFMADGEKLSRAFANIISNCIRYAKSKVLIKMGIEPSHIIITISDDGSGFEKNEIENIFIRFYKGKKGQSGLGLPITKSIIESHKGIIEAQNTGNGALFIITLPR